MVRPATGAFTESLRVSVTSNGELATGGGSFNPAISYYGNHIAFTSAATNLMLGLNGFSQIYVHDREVVERGLRTHGCTLLLSKNNAGSPGDSFSYQPAISANGRYIAFGSWSANLVEDDTNGVGDIFVVDRDADDDYNFYEDAVNCIPGPSRILRVSVASDGTQANGDSAEPDIAGNGDFVAFTSAATNLVPGDTNGLVDVFVHYPGFTDSLRFLVPEHRLYLPLITDLPFSRVNIR